jgi:hypothetical protein
MKAARNAYDETAFFYSEPLEGGYRIVGWYPREKDQMKLFFLLLERMGDRIEYLFKEEDLKSENPNQWTRISGGIYKNKLKALIQKYEKWFFNDSSFQFCAREPDINGYFAYDEHGIFFIYDKDEKENVKGLGAVEAPRELLTAKGHWHIRPKDAEKTLAEFKRVLKESSVFFDVEAEQGHPADRQ